MTDPWSALARRLAGRRIVQLISDLTFGDAASSDTVAWQRVFQRHGLESPIYARRIEGPHGGQAAPLDAYQPRADDLLLFHYTVWSEAAERVQSGALRHVMIYHNITPPGFFVLFEPRLAADARRGREQLAALAPLCDLGLADSEYSRQELVAAGFAHTGVVPILLDAGDGNEPGDPSLARELVDGRTNVLYTGRIAPNKRIEETIVVFAYYRRADPTARLWLVGAHDDTDQYSTALRVLIDRLGLRESVVFTGKLPRSRFVTHYRHAHVYLTMSEHEGFCVPLIEAMRLGVPIVARAAAAIPETAGDAAVLVLEKRFDVIAEALHVVRTDDELRRRLIDRGRRRAEAFAPARVEALMVEQLATVLG